MAPEYRKYLVGQAIAGAVINLVLNGAIGWLSYRHLPRVPLFGPQSIAGDVVVTSVLLPVLVCLIVTPLVRAEIRKGRLPAVAWVGDKPSRALPRPRNVLLRALLLGVLTGILVSPVLIGMLNLFVGSDGLGVPAFVVFKASLGAALAAVVTPITVRWTFEEGLPSSGVSSNGGR